MLKPPELLAPLPTLKPFLLSLLLDAMSLLKL
jgi:hypothetical protein